MTVDARAMATLAALVTTLLSASCGGDTASSRLSLTDDGCTYEGDETPPATETFEAEIENRSSKEGAFEIALIGSGGTFADVEAYVEMEQQRLEDGLEIVGPPSYLTLGARAVVPSGENGRLVSTVARGEWVLWCAQEHPPTALFLVRPSLAVS